MLCSIKETTNISLNMEKSINAKNYLEVELETLPEMKAKKAKERTMKEIRRVVRLLTAWVETEMPEQGDFCQLFEINYNLGCKMCCTEFVLIVTSRPMKLGKEETKCGIELTGYRQLCPYSVSKLIVSGTKDELMAVLKDPNLPGELYIDARNLDEIFDSES